MPTKHYVVYIPGFVANPAFKDFLTRAPGALKKLTAAGLRRILVVKPKSDRVVPLADMDITGAEVMHLPTNGHLWSIVAALTIHAPKLIAFIKRKT